MTGKLTLVPPDAPSPDMTEAQAREYLAAVRSPRLDDLRLRIPTAKTSELIAMLNPNALAEMLHPDASSQEELTMLVTATLFDVSTEIDRRIPAPLA